MVFFLYIKSSIIFYTQFSIYLDVKREYGLLTKNMLKTAELGTFLYLSQNKWDGSYDTFYGIGTLEKQKKLLIWCINLVIKMFCFFFLKRFFQMFYTILK